MRILLTTRRIVEEKRNPISLLDLAAFLRARGHAVDCYFMDQLPGPGAEPPGKTYDLTGLSVLQALDESFPLRDALHLKKTFNARTVVGGKWTETMPDAQRDAMRDGGIEVCVGQGERYFDPGWADFASYPSWDPADFRTLGEVNEEIMSTRGCPYRCNFCHNTEKKLSFFSASRTADNIELLLRLGSRSIFIVDDIFTLRAAHMSELLEELRRRGVDIRGKNRFFSHVNHLSPDILRQIAAYAPETIQLGIESGDDRMLKLMGKPFRGASVREDTASAWDRDQSPDPVPSRIPRGKRGEPEEHAEFYRTHRTVRRGRVDELLPAGARHAGPRNGRRERARPPPHRQEHRYHVRPPRPDRRYPGRLQKAHGGCFQPQVAQGVPAKGAVQEPAPRPPRLAGKTGRITAARRPENCKLWNAPFSGRITGVPDHGHL